MLTVAASLFAILCVVPQTGLENWKAGIAIVKITPDVPLQMSGYASRIKPFEGINDDIYAKALALQDSQGHKSVIITTDLIGFTAPITEPICKRISDRTGLKRQDILITAIHTHSAPTLSVDPKPRENYPASDARNTANYTKSLQNKIADLAVRAMVGLEPARLSYGLGMATFVMNRREFTPRGVILGFNPSGHIDRSVPILRIDGTDGKLRAVLFGCACHNTTLGQNNMLLSGDYGGYAQREIEMRNPGAVALMMLGCAGDANPHPRVSMVDARDHGKGLGEEVCRVLGGKLAPVRGPLTTVMETVPIPFADPPSRDEAERLAKSAPGYQQGVYQGILDHMKKRETVPTSYPAPTAVWQFGDDLTLVALSGEVVVDYVTFLQKTLGPLNLWIAAYANDVYGYLPSARVLEEGGYETRGTYAGPLGFFSAKSQDVLVAAVKQMAQKAGRKLP